MRKPKVDYKGRVILTYGRSLMALTAAHSLGKRGIEVIGCDSVDMTVLNFSRYVSDYFIYTAPENDLDAYLNDMEEHIRKFKPEDDRPYVLMPMFRDAKLLAQHKDRFSDLIDVAVPSYETIQKVETKDAFADLSECLGLQVPKTHKPESAKDLAALRDRLVFPCLIKPRDGVGGRGIHAAENFTELCTLFDESTEQYKTPPLVQEMIEGQDYCLSVICKDGEILAHMAYHNLHQFPRKSGAGIMRETIDDEIFMPTARKLLTALRWSGIAQLDFRWDGKEGSPAYLIEVNPRFWAGLFHSVESGVDFPWMLYQLASTGVIDEESRAVLGKKTKVPGLWLVSAIQDIAESETHFDKLKQVIQQSKRHDSWKERIVLLKGALSGAVDEKDIIEKIKAMRKEGKGAKSEFDVEDDPFIELGILFVISSLVRHGKLPPELKS